AQEIAPSSRRIGLLTNLADPKGPPQLDDLKAARRHVGLSVPEADVSTPDEIPSALDLLVREQVDVVVVLQTNLLLISSEPIAAIPRENRLTTVCCYEH